MSIKTPRLIRDRCGVFYFRFIVPLTWRQAVGKKELRRSLGTKEVTQARQSALLLSAQLEAYMAESKKNNKDDLIESYLKSLDAGESHKMKIRIFRDGSADIETDTDEEAKAAKGIIEARVARLATSSEALLPSSRCGTTLEKAQEDYLNERKATLSKNTMPKQKGVLKAFIAFAGNLDLAMVKPLTIKDYKKKMLGESKAPTYINDHLVILKGFFDYCIDNKIVDMKNPAEGLLIPGAHNKAESYEIFTQEEIGRIFNAKPYLKRMKLPDFYWGTLIALHTGARAEEIASLKANQIVEENGIWFINILKGKTINATRRVPLHPNLIKLGLIDYKKIIDKSDHTLLFPHLIDGKNGFKKNMGRAFAEHLDSSEVNLSHELKVFHSFRHTVVTMLTAKGVNDGLKKALVGHDIDSKTSAHDDYIHASGITLANLLAAISLLEFPKLDISSLKTNQENLVKAAQRRIFLREKAEAKKKMSIVNEKANQV